MRPTPTGETFKLLMCFLNLLCTQIDTYIPTICLLTIRTYLRCDFTAPIPLSSLSFGNSRKASSSSSDNMSDNSSRLSITSSGITCCSFHNKPKFPELWCVRFITLPYFEAFSLWLKAILSELHTLRNFELESVSGIASRGRSGQ
ncbi:hypothetical protein V8G54_003087 [Vigna mungo]|uniref:Uncharacterized protein n=1 Tax=Vigna mungo TaxID=3915 RepID=A0AAQ3SCL2_VIGMU